MTKPPFYSPVHLIGASLSVSNVFHWCQIVTPMSNDPNQMEQNKHILFKRKDALPMTRGGQVNKILKDFTLTLCSYISPAVSRTDRDRPKSATLHNLL